MAAQAEEIRGLWYCIEYRDRTRHKSCFGRGPTAAELAREAAKRVNAERALEKQGLLRTSSGMRLARYAEEWLRDVVEPHKTTGTIRNYRQLLEDHVLPDLGALPLSDLKPHVVKAFIAKNSRKSANRVGAGVRGTRFATWWRSCARF